MNDFLNLLTHMARKYGWEGDYTEIKDFVIWCYEEHGESAPVDLNPYETPKSTK